MKKNRDQLEEILRNYDPQRSLQHEQIDESTYCCNLSQKKMACVCKKVIYELRPYTFEILTSSQIFFEIIVYSELPLFWLN